MLAEAARSASDTTGVLAALQKAASATGSDFHYLLSTAMRESSLKPQAQSGTSSAAGLFQFVEQTWLGLVKDYGTKYGLGSMAGAISRDSNGHYRADSAADRQAILALRKDPQVAAYMEGEFSQATRANLQGALGRDVCDGELYAAHFLGPDAACRLIQMSATQPKADAAAAFPQAASANKTVFYHPDGTPKTAREIYDWALRQPSTASIPAGPVAMPSKPANANLAATTNIGASEGVSDLMASLASWSPHRGFFGIDEGGGSDGALPSMPFLLTPSVMDVLSSLSPVAQGH